MQYQELELKSLDNPGNPSNQGNQGDQESHDGHSIPLYQWLPSHQPYKGVFQIVHGMAEHSARYVHLAQRLTDKGYMVVAHDHRGHGRNTGKSLKGHYHDSNGWQKVMADLNQVYLYCQKHRPANNQNNGSHVLFAHSMGSFVTMNFLMDYPTSLSAIILSGSNYSPPIKYAAAAQIARFEKLRLGARNSSKLLNFISFGSFNGHFKPNRTTHDWLSRDPEQVDQYLNDPNCGFIATSQLWCDFLGGLHYLSKYRNLSRLPKNIPYYLLSGDKDPVGGMGKGVQALARQLKQSGIANLTCTLYPGGRHEMVNETNKEQVIQDMFEWLATQGILQDTDATEILTKALPTS
ncbi:alpha/beta fold hydrolase [Hahella ganghwensis]|uniref:alpha/beta fold hydrolase n=1 Tax=Hahella ganghwensis TaxID=286420 RepID=UPI00035EDAFE|nr:alpha/beta hydrolase [Hahella ganghwensis]